MNTRQHALNQRLQAFRFDETDDPALSFADRLAGENGWSATHTQRVLDEYRRFMFLCVEAGHPVTPSDAVDQAWHLHMIYTRSYWERMCGETLGQAVHHGPTKGGAAERGKFHDWYERTLDSYRSMFESEPPREIWQPASERFAPTRFVRIDRARHWIVSKPRVTRRTWAIAIAAMLVIAGVGCSTGVSSRDAGQLVAVAIFVGLAALIILLVLKGSSHRGGGGNSGCGGAGCGGAGGGCGGASGCGSGCGSGGGGCGAGCGGGCGGGCGS